MTGCAYCGAPAAGGTFCSACGAPVRSAKTNVFAILSLCLCLFPFVSIPFGHVALGQIKRTAENGRGLAITGLVVSYLLLAAYLALIAWLIVWGVQVSGHHSH